MSFGFPAYFSESRTYHMTQGALLDAVKTTLVNLAWRYEVLSANELQARVSVNLWSWGERLKVQISTDGAVRVESRCAFPLQCLDWGKNKENVQTFFIRLEQVKEIHAISSANESLSSEFDERGFSPVGRMLDEQNED